LDPASLAERKGAELVVNPPRSQERVIVRDRPWEQFMITFYLSVFEENGKLRMWYICRDAEKKPNLAYAESTDGVNWTKPELGVVEYGGSRANNLVGVTSLEGNVFRDPQPRSDAERYVYVSTVFKGGGIYRFTSPDGFTWQRDSQPLLPFEGDSQNVTFWDGNLNRYVSYLRGWDVGQPGGSRRKVVRLESDRLDRPSGVVPAQREKKQPADPTRDPFIIDELPTVFRCDEQDPADTDVYTNAVQPYPLDPAWYVGFPAFYRHAKQSPHRNDGWTETQFISSRDGKRWERYGREGYLRPGLKGSESASMLYMGTGLIVRGDEIWQYGTTYRTTHGDVPAREKGGDGVIYRFIQRVDGFVSLDFASNGGRARTLPVNVIGSDLLLNLDTGALGTLRVALLDENGQALPGFGIADCDPLLTNATGAKVTWKGQGDLTSLRGKQVSVSFEGSRTKLYSFRFE
ncbi:MAG TPA: hypothetical protein PLN52_18010, partial [Opitutaceae bacterium]|nr:hypothetical protein [Opitutaceae bacterium]